MAELIPLIPQITLVLLAVLVAACLILAFRLPRRNDTQKADTVAELAALQERISARDADLTNHKQIIEDSYQKLSLEQASSIALRERISHLETLLQQERKQHEDKLLVLQNAREQMSLELHKAREQMNLEFRNLANEILEQKGKSFGETSRIHIQELLKPLGEKIQLFEKKVEDTYDKESKQRFALEKEIKTLFELNSRISVDAINLTKALKGESKTQGVWGEVILERVLEKSGLEKGREYDIQVSLKDASGRLRQPDVVVHLPDKKDVIIDSKVSLTAYEGYYSAADDELRGQHLKQHIQSIRTHIRLLSEKNYQNLQTLKSLDYVLLFLPVEAAFTLAIQEDERLFTEAFEQNIILVGPSTLLATLRTIHNIWRLEYQSKNALDIAKRAGSLYDKFVAFTQDLEEVGKRIDQSQHAYELAHNKLMSGRGNLVTSVEKLKTLGARASKQLAEHLLEETIEESIEESIQESIEESTKLAASSSLQTEEAEDSAVEAKQDD
jgi:DNA recombination protein RmuC